jgi:hypothetical protein
MCFVTQGAECSPEAASTDKRNVNFYVKLKLSRQFMCVHLPGLDYDVLLTAWVSFCNIWVAANVEMKRISKEVLSSVLILKLRPKYFKNQPNIDARFIVSMMIIAIIRSYILRCGTG